MDDSDLNGRGQMAEHVVLPGSSLEFDCGIEYKRIEAWLDGELGLPVKGDSWTFASRGESCIIRLERLEPRALGSVEIERTHLLAFGDAGAIKDFEKLFTLRFMSAGG